ncbi:hypothetical protein AB834_06090 [PVC group bacterium (ex Bugula neritina AB1)]|nr:hypothetical protein AB834_06090 [PVC group bacterium (ex Bugula neritina AB1)]
MKRIHAFWLPEDDSLGELHFWAEDMDLWNQLEEAGSSSMHPYCVPQLELLSFLQKMISNKENWGLKSVSLELPSNNFGPVPSVPECRKVVPEGESLFFKTWTIRTVSMSSESVWKYLNKLDKLTCEKIELSDSVKYWMLLLNFTLELLVRGRFSPKAGKLSDKRNMICAEWIPYLNHEDHARFLLLIDAAPASAWLIIKHLKRKYTSKYICWHFVKDMLDTFIRIYCNKETPYIYRSNSSKKNTTIHEKWFKSLFLQNKNCREDSKKIAKFVDNMENWAHVIDFDYDFPFRICFYLNEPEEKHDELLDTEWVLTYCLQAVSGDQKMIFSKDWLKKDFFDTLEINITKEEVDKFIRKHLQRASRHFERLIDLLNIPEDPAIVLTNLEASDFLRKASHLLENSGFRLILPSFWKKALKEIGLSLDVKSKSQGNDMPKSMGLDILVNYNWNIIIGGKNFSREEIPDLLNREEPLVKVGKEWVFVDPDEIQKAIDFFEKKAKEPENVTLGEIAFSDTEDLFADTGLDIVSINYDKNLQTILASFNEPETLKMLEAPDLFKGDLRPYQTVGLSWLMFLQKVGLGGCLADDMGLGKTIQLIAFFLKDKELAGSEEVDPTLVLCPMSIMSNWKNEIKKFAPHLRVMIHHGTQRLNHEDFVEKVKDCDVVITTYALVDPELDKLHAVNWRRIVLDEAQNIKNNHTKQTQAIKKLRSLNKVAVTGTPLENRLLEIWSIIDFLNPGYLGSEKYFKQKYSTPIERLNDQKASTKLKQIIRPMVLRRLKTDARIIKDLPDKIESKELCYLTAEQVSLYESVFNNMLNVIDNYDGIQRRGVILSVLVKLKQICNHPAQYLKEDSFLHARSGKVNRLYEILKEIIAEGDKTLIFTQFSNMGHLLQKDCERVLNRKVLFLHGVTTYSQRNEMVESFQKKDSDCPIFILSLKAGGLGLNLTSANHVFHFDRWWNPAIENQATDRAFRIGQKKTVHVYKLLCQGTVEERIDDMIDRKKEIAEMVLENEASKDWITTLSTEDLKKLFQLKAEVVDTDEK